MQCSISKCKKNNGKFAPEAAAAGVDFAPRTGYAGSSVLKTPRSAVPRPDSSGFFVPVSEDRHIPVYAGCEANTKPFGEIRPPSDRGFEHPAPISKMGHSKNDQEAVMPTISIKDLVLFSPNFGVEVTSKAIGCDPSELWNAVQLAFKHLNDEPLRDANCGGKGPLAEYDKLDFYTYLSMLEDINRRKQISEKTIKAKRFHTSKRRSEFSSSRSHLFLSLINLDIPYVCSIEGCQNDDLTIDHVIPLSRGGTDDVTNLRFLCRQHNSQKGDRER